MMERKSLIVILLSAILLTSCSFHGPTDKSQANSEQRLTEILEIVQNKDRNALKTVFSKYALDNSENIDENIDLLFEYFKGDVVSAVISGHGMTKGNYPDGRSEMIMYAPCTVVTSEQTYYMYFTDYVKYTENRDKEGVLCLYIIIAEEHTSEYLYRFDGREIAGLNIGVPCVRR